MLVLKSPLLIWQIFYFQDVLVIYREYKVIDTYLHKEQTMANKQLGLPDEIRVDTQKLTEIGVESNMQVVTVDNYLVIVIDMTKDMGLSSTGKMRSVANTGGFQSLPGELKGNIWVGRKAIP